VFAGEDLIELNRSLDKNEPALIIYHSHPNGRAYLSETDRSVATSPWGDGPAYPVQQLVVGIHAEKVVESALFAWSDEENGFVEVARFEGADV
jgi:proteasome lid subunit RPN8/RPN11